MKRKMINFIIILIFSLCSVTVVQAATKYINSISVERIFVGDGKISLVVAGNVDNVCYFQYYNNSLFVKNLSEDDSYAILSSLLSAKSMNKNIKIAYYDDGNFDVNDVGTTACSIRWVMIE